MSTLPETPTSPLASAILEGRAPGPIKLSAARGVLPLSRADLVRVLVHLADEDDAAIRDEAAGTLAAITDDDLVTLVVDPGTSTDVLDHFGGMPGASPAVRSAILANPSTPDDTLRRMIPSLSPAQIDDLLLNQRRLIDTPELLALLELNPASTALQRSRMEEIRRHFHARPEPMHHEPRPAPKAVETAPEPAREEAAVAQGPATEEIEEIVDEEDRVAAQRIMRLTTAEKVKLAFRATREERTILIRDTSRSVQSAVLDCPMLTDQDIEAFAKMRSVSDEVLRTIAGNRNWMKNYRVLFSLTTNPKTPIRVSMNLVAQLNPRDLRYVVVDKNVPEAVRRQARKVIDARNARQGRH